MSESSFLELFRCRWQEIARQFWPETPRQQLQSELARLDLELGRRQRRLLILRKRIEKVHNYLKNCDQGRQRSIDRLRELLQERENEYARRLARLRQRKQDRAKLRERLFSGTLPKVIGEESDPYYPF